jgi:hypothetical protein
MGALDLINLRGMVEALEVARASLDASERLHPRVPRDIPTQQSCARLAAALSAAAARLDTGSA